MSEDFVNAPTLPHGWSALAAGNVERAAFIFRACLARMPHMSEPVVGLAHLAGRSGDWARAAGLAGLALPKARSEADQLAVHAILGQALLRLGHHEEARAALTIARTFAPTHRQVLVDLAQALSALGRLPEALDIYRLLAEILPDDPAAHANLGAALFAASDFDAAANVLSRAMAIGPPSAETLNTLGLVEMARGALDAAESAFTTAGTSDVRIANNYATLLLERGQHDRAATIWARQLQDDSGLEADRAAFNLGTVRLGQGRWHEGWALFERRLALLSQTPDPLPEWDGAPGIGRIRVEAEQGLGDILQFARFLPQAAARVPLALRLPETAQGLLNLHDGLRGLDAGRVIEGEAPCVARCSLLSLPFKLGLESIESQPYLSAESPADHQLFTIGVAWRGNPAFRFDLRRSLPDTAIANLRRDVDAKRPVRWYSLQRDRVLTGFEHVDLSSLASTAQAVAACNLVIAADTAIAHLAGAMGRPVWLLNRYGGDWRWFDAPHTAYGEPGRWYRTVRQFQASDPRPAQAWEPVIARVTEALLNG